MKFFMLIIGFALAVFGGVSLVAYLNLLTVGYSLQNFLLFLVQRIETYMFAAGIFIIWIIVYFPMKRGHKRKKI
ncbi:hypothetical protein K8O68_21030 [Salipaludibacillus sp. CUR1]|uniref:hypothetical protein n=1 Tax=Salipaludibacillus sp. CUR1 TaxID=2820003 RepID=UPI001E3CAB41|nr:hypothetical protein [Salipaludibacillus sp. CUR1]MCE7794876.1 hypothetical protein [Salipaludibacillus sp. CUR1]